MPTVLDYQATCTHDHSDVCGQCNGLAVTIEKIEKATEAMARGPEDLSKRQIHDEIAFMTRKAKRDVNAWNSHLLRSVNPDKARLDILQDLDDGLVLLIQD